MLHTKLHPRDFFSMKQKLTDIKIIKYFEKAIKIRNTF